MSDVLDLVNGNSVADMILGYRVDRSDAASRRIFTWVYNKLIRILFPKVSVHDADVGLRLYRKEVVSQILKQDLFFSELLSSEITIILLVNFQCAIGAEMELLGPFPQRKL
jgi:hypothetical protein